MGEVGGVVGSNFGEVLDCSISGKIVGDYSVVGGVVGDNGNKVENCFASAGNTVEGVYFVGGVVGRNFANDEGNGYAIVKNCYNAGSVTSSNNPSGGVVGANYADNSVNNYYALVEDCYNTGNVIGLGGLGGVVGTNERSDSGSGFEYAVVKNCYNTGDVEGYDNVIGGVIGSNSRGTIQNCYNTGDVKGESYIGGVVGENKYGNIQNSYNTGNVEGNDDYVGGVVGYNEGDGDDDNGIVQNCYNTGDVEGSQYIGGVVGNNFSSVQNCYSTGNVEGVNNVGGVAGRNFGSVHNCMALNSMVEGTGVSADYVGRVVGRNMPAGDLDNNYARHDLIPKISGAEKDPLVNDVDGGRFVFGNISFTETGLFTDNNIWDIPQSDALILGGELPRLIVFSAWTDNPYPTLPYIDSSGSGASEDDPIIISSAASLRKIGASDGFALDAYFLQTADIDLGGISNWTPIGDDNSGNSFTGVYDGGGFAIKNLTIDSADYFTGLFGCIQGTSLATSIVKNVRLVDVNITNTSGYYIGGIVGYISDGKIENCFVSGEINGGHNTGGIAGYVTRETSTTAPVVQNCYVTANISAISGSIGAGGVVGSFQETTAGILQNCYTISNVSGFSGVGGMVGYIKNSSVTVQNCIALNATVTGSSVGRVFGWDDNSSVTLQNNYARADMKIGSGAGAEVAYSDTGAGTIHGADITYLDWSEEEWWTSIGFTSANGWAGILPEIDPLPTEGTRGYPFAVTQDTLQYVGKTNNPAPYENWTPSAHYRQTADIGTSGTIFTHTRIGYNAAGSQFTGVYDGNGKTITGLKIDASDNQGMFGCINPGSIVKNVHLVDASIKGGLYTGGIAGYNRGGTIQNCSVSGNSSVTGTSNDTGGIVGRNETSGSNNAIISNCYNTGSVTSSGNNVGGILGQNVNGTVQYCYNTGEILCGGDYAGGVVGFNSGSASRRYCVALNASITRTNGSSVNYGRLTGATGGSALSNYARSDMVYYASPTASASTFPDFSSTGKDGASITLGSENATFAAVFGSWDASVWNIPTGIINVGSALPTLIGAGGTQNPTIPTTAP
uniref:GLUG n=1 Tax=uncultured bacterium contig00049 TaxID=1181534 RepID=A0A806KHB9_9BACT|nr:GLUG [uncultured bacterium contig00049]